MEVAPLTKQGESITTIKQAAKAQTSDGDWAILYTPCMALEIKQKQFRINRSNNKLYMVEAKLGEIEVKSAVDARNIINATVAAYPDSNSQLLFTLVTRETF